MFFNKKRKISMEKQKKEEFRDSVFIQNLSNLLWAYTLAAMEAKEAQAYLCKEVDQIKLIQQREQANAKACLTADVAKSLMELSEHFKRLNLATQKTQSIETILNGMEMINKEMDKAMQALQIERISPVGALFNPHDHELGGVFFMPELEENRIIEVLRDGYRCGDRWIRHPLVVVNQHKNEN
jgi:molecular chaperone GrpE